MADLLECLIQVKALAHTIARLERFVAAAPAGARADIDATLVWMVDAERDYARALRGEAALPPLGCQGTMVERFATARRATLRTLDGCSAEDLGRPVDWPSRPGISVADLVAIMLAHDIDRIAEIRRAEFQA